MSENPGADYPFDPEVQAQMLAECKEIPPPEPPSIPPPGPGGGMPEARLGNLTAHFGVIGSVVTGMTVLIGFQTATMGDPHVCRMFDGPKPYVGGTIRFPRQRAGRGRWDKD